MTQGYQEHLAELSRRYQDAMTHFELDAIVLAAGKKNYYFNDDQSTPFRAYSGAQQWLPFTLESDTYLIIQADKKPTLIWSSNDDFWHAPNPVPNGGWQHHWNIIEVSSDTKWFSKLPKKTAWLGPNAMDLAVSCPKLQSFIDFNKAVKTPYEIEQIRLASQRAVKGHIAAKNAFLAGESEFHVHLAFLKASQQTADQEPYSGIVAINENASILHYEHKSIQASKSPLSLLIDAGAKECGYACDITRTFYKYNDEFSDLVDDLNIKQQSIANLALSGTPFRQLHTETLIHIAQLLKDHDLCSLEIEEQLDKGIPQIFFPHGLGHLLGLQVHDVGGFLANQSGDLKMPDEAAPFLRLTRTLEENMVITIEPGLYFIPMLINKMIAEQPKHGCNLNKIKALMPYGGIRIEDNILVKNKQVENITRQTFLEQGVIE
ncbi:Xaa-Pro dipeptidase [Marinomonas sp. C2222]|uniref:Xaa-Pro dipeptidase n=1 Tax=Marinomonas sargassi TaxID=2984494 RepID=A0ABT2YV51_9GAMM|nr:Xaa-Pro dipeptidase [Marinomonas sargassi]MCV2403640.1 Xaa-Pro dipeptidase [Marinomonas sargassi]